MFYSGGILQDAIGKPDDYTKNKDDGRFPEDTILRIPGNESQPSSEQVSEMLGQKRVMNRK